MNKDIQAYNNAQTESDQKICDVLAEVIDSNIKSTENKIWHGHPVWFIGGNPIVGYSKLKDSVRLMFWSGVDFNEDALEPGTGKFKDASIRFTSKDQIVENDVIRWLKKA